jgi:hypothetical protein
MNPIFPPVVVRSFVFALALATLLIRASASPGGTQEIGVLINVIDHDYEQINRAQFEKLSAKELLRELDVLKAAGLGGFEINTIGMPEGATAASLAAHPVKAWLTPEWNESARLTADAARARNLTADLIGGSGWPFGGQFLEPEEQTQRLLLAKRTLRGPAHVGFTQDELFRPDAPAKSGHEREPEPTRSEFVFCVSQQPLSGSETLRPRRNCCLP